MCGHEASNSLGRLKERKTLEVIHRDCMAHQHIPLFVSHSQMLFNLSCTQTSDLAQTILLLHTLQIGMPEVH